MLDFFAAVTMRAAGEQNYFFNSYILTPAAIFALGDLMCGTLFQLAFGRFGLKISTRSLFRSRSGGD